MAGQIRGQVRGSGGHFVYSELKRRILELEFEPGLRLYEPALAEELGVSRTPLREGIRRLITENLLEQQPTGGVVVPRLDEREIAELYDVRAALEALMAAEACRRITPEEAEVLEGVVARNAALVTFAEDAMRSGRELHARIAGIAANTWALRMHEQIGNQMQRYRAFTNHTQERRDQALADHRRICAAVVGGEPEEAGRLAFEHVVSARDEALRAIGGRLSAQ
ncbi:GntR family transcriptional regulator [Kineosporia sp. NBRC 101677]|uniref:GntR family transcriptional regulator n=1 Tax=Kineosporia sp. NBRC 101677 TaxID=3032197 RepID=UPI0024A3B8B1|nr:GntR family transcriptional regulator [Kineosporia sp. NBRC 101677]GLY17103.1 GntR family transcriptional regulator [Kineosporia sp. NBRC 101677]